MTAENESENLPQGLKDFLIENKIPHDRPWVSRLYRRKKDPKELKLKNYYLEKLENACFEGDLGEDYIKDKYGGGRYQVIITWKTAKNEKSGIELEEIYIDGPELDQSSNEPSRRSDVPPMTGGIQKNNEEPLEDKISKWLPIITAMVGLVKEVMPKPDTTIIDKLQGEYVKKLSKLDDEILEIKRKKLEKEVEGLEEMEGGTMTNEQMENIYPAWLQPYAPIIDKFATSLLGNSYLSNTLKKVVVSSDAFKKNWNDDEKRAEAVEAISQHLGPEVAESLEQTFNEYMGGNH